MNMLDTSLGRVEIRELSGLEELAAAEPLQLEVWGRETLPESRELFLAVQHAGGLVGGAFDPSGALVGLVFSFPTRDPVLQHSHRLAVLPAWRGQGLAPALKWFQRDWCLERGVTRVEWTVDPLRMPNAALNAGLLGAGAATYLLDYYGAMQGIDAGLPSDRLWMEWRLASPRVAALSRKEVPPDRSETAWPANRVQDGCPRDPRPDLDAPLLRLAIPADFSALSLSDPDLALEWRLHVRLLFQAFFARGYAVCGFTRSGGPAYLLERNA